MSTKEYKRWTETGLSVEEENALARAANQGDEKAKEKVCRFFDCVVLAIAKYFANKQYYRESPLDDFIQAGRLGLLRAVKNYKREDVFRLFAARYIVGDICEDRRTASFLHMPRRFYSQLREVEDIEFQLIKGLGRFPTYYELVTALPPDVQKVFLEARILNPHRKLLRDEDEHEDLILSVPDKYEKGEMDKIRTPEGLVEDKEELELFGILLTALIDGLPEEQERVVKKLFSQKPKPSAREVAEDPDLADLNLTEARVFYVRRRALKKISECMHHCFYFSEGSAVFSHPFFDLAK